MPAARCSTGSPSSTAWASIPWRWCRTCSSSATALSRLKLRPEAAAAVGLAGEPAARARVMAEQLTLPVLARAWQMLLRGVEEVRTAPDGAAAAEMLLLRLTCVSDLPPPGELARLLQGGCGVPVPAGGTGGPCGPGRSARLTGARVAVLEPSQLCRARRRDRRERSRSCMAAFLLGADAPDPLRARPDRAPAGAERARRTCRAGSARWRAGSPGGAGSWRWARRAGEPTLAERNGPAQGRAALPQPGPIPISRPCSRRFPGRISSTFATRHLPASLLQPARRGRAEA